LVLAGGRADRLENDVTAAAAIGRVLVILLPGVRADPWRLLAAGADDVVDADAEALVESVLARLERWAEVAALVDSDVVRKAAVGGSAAWQAAVREAVEAARFTTSPVLLLGETGTGKEVIARLIHELDPRPGLGEMALVDCTTVVPSLSGSEFFGHEKGAFTGASTTRTGAFELADGGTLFLDEIGDLPQPLQAALLRVVQEGVYKPVGGNRWQQTRFRLLCATNRDLQVDQDAGTFRRDLYFRIAASTIRLPPLRERIDDIVPLFRHFVAHAWHRPEPPELDPAVADLLLRRDYPGNVRDLRQLAVRVATRHVGDGPITPGDVPAADRPPGSWTVQSDGHDTVAGPAGGAPTKAGASDGQRGWRADLERAIRGAMSTGVGLKELKELVPELATSIALADAGGPGAAARMLGVSRRAVEYRKANGLRHPH